ncbi:hypothetical protein KSD_90200 [Ktedonobacter sp. SOSP1-85]|uniref:STAS domain-containing protein n=1 Tax=Ktedonobacter sp. SOSP1-85 TaxID=2778367 RepID=UPI00191665A9|nr:STAS domain-containing protein [Ktedonobacter sp. SOSP1-85]GHO81249.1 hypothetical protein KSD_90200 [Ktedonobacter sp. SOSP1-85]
MATASFEAHIRHQARVAIIDLQGEINNFAADTLDSAYMEAVSGHPETILLNFSQVDYMNSVGIALIVGMLKRALKAKCPLMVYGLSEHFVEIFRITRLADFMLIFSDEAQALNSIPPSRS